MRSVFVYLRDTTKAEVTAYLDRTCQANGPDWVVTVGEDPCLYISVYHDSIIAFAPDEWTDLVRRFGSEPDVIVSADISGRYPGDAQTYAFVTDLLTQFRGGAMDEYTDHLWSLDELRSRHKVSGHPFFDYNGWFLEKKGIPIRDALLPEK
jgi:hypothetical protein